MMMMMRRRKRQEVFVVGAALNHRHLPTLGFCLQWDQTEVDQCSL